MNPAASDPVAGTPFGRYRLLELLGRGGMGEVWRAYDTTMQRAVALKVLPANLADDDAFQQRFHREARAAAGLDEPHVVPIHDYGEIDGRLYVTMQLIRGNDLQSLLANGPLPPHRAVAIIDQIAAALHAAHTAGLIHRDVKPSNILVTDDDFAYLIDFGIARATEDTALTATGSVIGTWAYLAPERLTTGQADARADIYALTCVLYETLTGQRPYPGDSLEQQIVGHLSTPAPKPTTVQPTLPAHFDTIIATGLAKDPDQRYPSTKALAHAAHQALNTTGPRGIAAIASAATQSAPIVRSRLADYQAGQDAPARVPQPTGMSHKEFLLTLTGALLVPATLLFVYVALGSGIGSLIFPEQVVTALLLAAVPGLLLAFGSTTRWQRILGGSLSGIGIGTLCAFYLVQHGSDEHLALLLASILVAMALTACGLAMIFVPVRRRRPMRAAAIGSALTGASTLAIAVHVWLISTEPILTGYYVVSGLALIWIGATGSRPARR